MLFKEYTYSVLIVSPSEKFAESIRPLLPENDFAPVETVGNAGEARRKLAQRDFDIVLVTHRSQTNSAQGLPLILLPTPKAACCCL